MRERPILFNGDMVRAILAGQKTQTRRVVKPAPQTILNGKTVPWEGDAAALMTMLLAQRRGCPFGQPGDRLWVREAHAIFPTHGQHRADGERWGPWGGLPTALSDDGKQIAYYREGFDRCDPGRWRPSIHMPRWACRLVLEITAVRVERLQAISEAAAIAEGLSQSDAGSWLPGPCDHPEWAFHQLWAQVYGEPAWEANPWVWVIEFKRVEADHG